MILQNLLVYICNEDQHRHFTTNACTNVTNLTVKEELKRILISHCVVILNVCVPAKETLFIP